MTIINENGKEVEIKIPKGEVECHECRNNGKRFLFTSNIDRSTFYLYSINGTSLTRLGKDKLPNLLDHLWYSNSTEEAETKKSKSKKVTA